MRSDWRWAKEGGGLGNGIDEDCREEGKRN